MLKRPEGAMVGQVAVANGVEWRRSALAALRPQVLRPPSPNRTCEFPRIRLSMLNLRLRVRQNGGSGRQGNWVIRTVRAPIGSRGMPGSHRPGKLVPRSG
jgi:hypothetical protein